MLKSTHTYSSKSKPLTRTGRYRITKRKQSIPPVTETIFKDFKPSSRRRARTTK